MMRRAASLRDIAARICLTAGCAPLLFGAQPAWAGQTVTPNITPDSGSGATDVTITGVDSPQTDQDKATSSKPATTGNASSPTGDLAQTGVNNPLAMLAIAACGSCALFAATSESPSRQRQ